MAKTEDSREKHRFYDVESFKQLLTSQKLQPQPSRLLKILRRAQLSIGSVGGVFTALAGLPIMFGGIFAVIVGILYGPLVFLAVLGSAIGLLSLYLDRKVGKSLQFGEYPFHKKVLGQVLGFALLMGLLYLMIMVTDLIAWIRRFL